MTSIQRKHGMGHSIGTPATLVKTSAGKKSHQTAVDFIAFRNGLGEAQFASPIQGLLQNHVIA
jgi:hypothetical protein